MAISRERADEIIQQNYDVIYKFCCSKCRNQTDAQDITQDVFFIFSKNLNKIADIYIDSWLFKVAYNEVKKYFKKNKMQKEYASLEDCIGLEYEYGLCDKSGIEDNVIFSETQQRIMSILTDEEKELFRKFYIAEIRPKAVAEETGITEDAVYVKKYRLRNKIIKFLNNDGFVLLVIGFKIFSECTKR